MIGFNLEVAGLQGFNLAVEGFNLAVVGFKLAAQGFISELHGLSPLGPWKPWGHYGDPKGLWVISLWAPEPRAQAFVCTTCSWALGP